MAQKILVINALAKEYYDDCHIKGSISIPLNELANYAKKLDKNQEIVVYCATYDCPVSKKAWHLLNDLGFKNLKAYEGGMNEWLKIGFAYEGACKSDYLKKENKPEKADAKVKTISAQELKRNLNHNKTGRIQAPLFLFSCR